MAKPQIAVHEIDAVASYIQAARELRQSAFFDQDYHRLGFTSVGQQLTSIELPDPNVRDSMLLSFRRIWSDNEPSNFFKVAKIIARHIPQWRQLLKTLRSQGKRHLGEFECCDPIDTPEGLSPNDVLDLWINARFFHSGKGGRVGRFTRNDFERHRTHIGEVQFEYLMLVAALYVGVTYGNLLQFAENALSFWQNQGIQPSFRLDAINVRGEQTSEDGIKVDRATPGWSVTNESLGNKVTRLLRRGRFRAFKSFAEMLGVDYDRLATAISSSESLDKMCAILGLNVKEAEIVDFNDADAGIGFCDDERTVWKSARSRKGTAVRKGRVVLVADDALPILNDQFASFRRALGELEKE